jgi:hypothetical protein
MTERQLIKRAAFVGGVLISKEPRMVPSLQLPDQSSHASFISPSNIPTKNSSIVSSEVSSGLTIIAPSDAPSDTASYLI